MAAFFHTVDQSILLWLQDAIRCPALSALLVPLTIVGEGGIIWILISAVMLFFPRTRKIGWMALVAMLLCYLLNDKLFKVLVEPATPLFRHGQSTDLNPHPTVLVLSLWTRLFLLCGGYHLQPRRGKAVVEGSILGPGGDHGFLPYVCGRPLSHRRAGGCAGGRRWQQPDLADASAPLRPD